MIYYQVGIISFCVVILFAACFYYFKKKPNIPDIDWENIYFIIGICFLGTGLWMYKPWVSFVVVGLIFMLLAFLPVILRIFDKR